MTSAEVSPRKEVSPCSESSITYAAEVRPHLYESLSLLLQAYDYADELDQDTWDLAVELDELRRAKLTNADLRWLEAKGYVEHAVETTGPDDEARHFRRTSLLRLSEPTCVVLTPAGVAMAREIGNVKRPVSADTASVGICSIPAAEIAVAQPRWDHQRRQLRLGSHLVKEFKLPSRNQETVLMAFEEDGWPPRIDDPLPPVAHVDPRRRLHDTIKALNRKQKQTLIRFRGDGSGEGIRWEPTSAEIEPAHGLESAVSFRQGASA